MQNLSQPFPKQAHASDTKEQENQQATTIPEKSSLQQDEADGAPPAVMGYCKSSMQWLRNTMSP